MSLTLVQLEDQVELIWGSNHDGRFDMDACIDQAGRHLFDMHSWAWRQRPSVTLGFTADQSYVLLPDDFGFGEVISVIMHQNVIYTAIPSTLHQVQSSRTDPIAVTTSLYYWAISYPDQLSAVSVPPLARLELYPTPTTADADAIQFLYLAGWKPLAVIDAIANIPSAFDALLIRLVRAYAGMWLPGAAAQEQAVETPDQIESSPMVERLKRADGAVHSNLGRIDGGQLAGGVVADYGWNYEFSSSYYS